MPARVRYTGKSLEIYENVIKIICGEKGCYNCNHIYKLNNNRYVYINTRGYLHALIPTNVFYNGKFNHYAITDYILKRDNGMLEVTKEVGNYKTKEDTIKAILDWFN